MTKLPPPLAPFASYTQFIPYQLTPHPNGKMAKKPIDHRTGFPGDPTDPALWMTFEQCAAYSENVGFVFTEHDPFFFLDIDAGYDTATSQWSDVSQHLVAQFPGAAVEVSQSGTGLHIFGVGHCPPHGCKNDANKLDFFTEKRFCALTGLSITGDAATEHSAALASMVATYFPQTVAMNDSTLWTLEPVDGWDGPTDDEALVAKAIRSKSNAAKFGGKASFEDLFNRNSAVLSKFYHDNHDGREFDESCADSALAFHLAFWTGNDCDRIERIMRSSELVRDKWERADYLRRTILKAVSTQTNFYADPTKKKKEAPVDLVEVAGELFPDEGEQRDGVQFMPTATQQEYFKGCVYISDIHRVLIPSGKMLKQDSFRVRFGGYIFARDTQNHKTTTNAWEAFTESQGFHCPKVDRSTFRPQEAPGAIIAEDNETMVNSFVDLAVTRVQGDASLFYDLLARLLPDERDRTILLSYMAAVVQHQGVKFQWCPLIQGVEGNGKSFLSKAVIAAVGKKYTHMPPANDIANNFNSWILDKVFIGIEDIYVPGCRVDILEALKPMITSDYQAATFKGVDQSMADICANFIMNSNHKDAVMKTGNDRRFCIFYTAQQNAADLTRDGLTPGYMTKLYTWFNSGGAAIITNELFTYAIPDEFNPATGCPRAPETTSTTEAVTLGQSPVQQEIIEATEAGRVGFKGGWVSSIHLEELLSNMRIKMTHQKRKKLIVDLGYVPHPGLTNGRACSPVPLDMGRKPRLYIKAGRSIAEDLTAPKDIVAAYVTAQGNSEAAANEAKFAGAI